MKESIPSRKDENSFSDCLTCSSLCPALKALELPAWKVEGCGICEVSAHAVFPVPLPADGCPLPAFARAAAARSFNSLLVGAVKALLVKSLAEATTRDNMDDSSSGSLLF